MSLYPATHYQHGDNVLAAAPNTPPEKSIYRQTVCVHNKHTHTHTRKHACTHACTHAHTHTYTHTHTHTPNHALMCLTGYTIDMH